MTTEGKGRGTTLELCRGGASRLGRGLRAPYLVLADLAGAFRSLRALVLLCGEFTLLL